MNTLKTTRLLACALLLFTGTQAQTTENGAMASLPAVPRLACRTASLEKLFHASGKISVSLSPAILIKGMLLSQTNPNPETVSLNIRLDDSVGSVLSIARIRLEDGSIHYTGHILRLHGSEAWVLMESDDQYYFERMEQRLLIAE